MKCISKLKGSERKQVLTENVQNSFDAQKYLNSNNSTATNNTYEILLVAHW